MTVKSGKLCNAHIWSNKKTQYVVLRWLDAHAIFDITCFPAFVGALDVILSVLPIANTLIIDVA